METQGLFWKPGSDRETTDSQFIPTSIQNRYNRLPLVHQRTILPVYSHKNEILYAVEKYPVTIIVGETGTGKSTQIPQYLHEAGWTRMGSSTSDASSSFRVSSSKGSTNEGKAVVCTQPRRVAAVNISTRVAQEFGCEIGEEVGYNVRFHTKISSKTVIKYCTDGVLLRETLSDPLLSKYSVVIVDEAHERSLQSDLLLGILKKIIKKRTDLRIIITSATINADILCDYFNDSNEKAEPSNTVRVLSLQGRLHPVDIFYVPKPVAHYIRAAIDTVISIHKSQPILGDILVFLPGIEDIHEALELLSQRLEEIYSVPGKSTSYTSGSREGYMLEDIVVLPLHSSLPTSAQLAIFDPTPSNKRKVILATNIAESSVTIQGINHVVDTGYSRLNYFDVETNVEYLVTCPISQASANQRAGRAGRTAHGKCYRLYTEESYVNTLKPFTPSEMQRIDISWAILQLKALGVSNILRFDYLTPPSTDHVIFALEFLYSLGAIDIDGNITLLGEKVSEMSIDIRLAKCLVASYELGCSEEMLSIAAMCSVEYPFHAPGHNNEAKKKYWENVSEFVAKEGDHLTLLNIYKQFIEHNCDKSWCDQYNIHHRIMVRAKEVRYHLEKMLLYYLKDYINKQNSTIGEPQESNIDVILSSCGTDTVSIRKCLIAGYFSHAAKLESDGFYRTIRGKVKVEPHTSSILSHFGAYPEWIIFHEAIHTKNMTQIRDVTRIDPMWLLEMAPHYYKVNK